MIKNSSLNNSRFYANTECEYYPCHKLKKINCLFCYCPLYNYNCGGKFTIIKNGIKDCSKCPLPHSNKGYDYIVKFIKRKNKKRMNPPR